MSDEIHFEPERSPKGGIGDYLRRLFGHDELDDRPMQHETIHHADGTVTHVEFPEGRQGAAHVSEAAGFWARLEPDEQ
jgi:hypothetical protein